MWRDNFAGLEYYHEPTGLTVSGAIDDVWQDTDGNLLVDDYKATSKAGRIETLTDSAWEGQYQRQIGVYQWLLEKMGFSVNKTGYFVYANALQTEEKFDNKLIFDTTLVSCEGDTSWIEPTLHQIKDCLEADDYPESGALCEYCPYREACGKKLQQMHRDRTKDMVSGTTTTKRSAEDAITRLKQKYA